MIKYTLRVTNDTDVDGMYAARVYMNDSWQKTFFSPDRDKALVLATDYVTWLRAADMSEELIEL